jgi:hypothetical protein
MEQSAERNKRKARILAVMILTTLTLCMLYFMGESSRKNVVSQKTHYYNYFCREDISVSNGDSLCLIYDYSSGPNTVGAFVVKINSFEDGGWVKKYEDSVNDREYKFDTGVGAVDNEGYVLIGEVFSTGFNEEKNRDINGLVLKLNLEGELEWSKEYGGPDYDNFLNIIALSDGYLIVGYSYDVSTNIGETSEYDEGEDWGNMGRSDALVLKLDLAGDVIWAKNFGGSERECFYDAIETIDGYLVVGYSESESINLGKSWTEYDEGEDWHTEGKSDGIIMKLDYDGEVVWVKNYGGSSEDSFRKIIETKENEGYLIKGRSYGTSKNIGPSAEYDKGYDWAHISKHYISDGVLVMIDAGGNVLWTQVERHCFMAMTEKVAPYCTNLNANDNLQFAYFRREILKKGIEVIFRLFRRE